MLNAASVIQTLSCPMMQNVRVLIVFIIIISLSFSVFVVDVVVVVFELVVPALTRMSPPWLQ